MQGNNESLHHGISHKPGLLKKCQTVRRNMRPKKRLVMAERTEFMSMKQEIDEPIIRYQYRFRNARRYCEFKELGQEEQMTEQDLIQLRIIEDMYNTSHKYKIMGQLQIGNMFLNICIDFIQQKELIQKYNHDKSQSSE